MSVAGRLFCFCAAVMNQSGLWRFARAVLLAGPLLVLSLGALAFGIFALLSPNQVPAWQILLAWALVPFGLAGVLWLAGFWGRWSLALFFLLAPLLIVVDYAINPFFPVGVILAAVGFDAFGRQRVQENRADPETHHH